MDTLFQSHLVWQIIFKNFINTSHQGRSSSWNRPIVCVPIPDFFHLPSATGFSPSPKIQDQESQCRQTRRKPAKGKRHAFCEPPSNPLPGSSLHRKCLPKFSATHFRSPRLTRCFNRESAQHQATWHISSMVSATALQCFVSCSMLTRSSGMTGTVPAP